MNEKSKQSGILVEHDDGRKGVMLHEDMHLWDDKQNKGVVRFFESDINSKLSDEKRLVKFDKLKHIGFID